ncbi:MAG: response regulator, partial [Caulobacter sp.]
MRVLIVEDEIMVAMLVEDLLTDLGCVVTGPAVSAETAVEAARREDVDFALLDVNLDGERGAAVEIDVQQGEIDVLAPRRLN